MQSGVHLKAEPPCREAARAVDGQLKAVASDVAYGLKGSARRMALDLGRGQSRIIGLQ
jgi:hypothetical protein